MNSIVQELQREALETDTPLDKILIKALVVSRKLNIEIFRDWVNAELNGYTRESIPDYRILHGELKILDSYGFPNPVVFDKSEMNEMFSKYPYAGSIKEIISILKNTPQESLKLHYFAEHQRLLMPYSKGNEMYLSVPKSRLEAILSRVRTIIVDWTLNLEEKGILGHDMTFSDKEKENAIQNVMYIHTMMNSQIQCDTNNSTQILNVQHFKIEELKPLVDDLTALVSEISNSTIKQDLISDLDALKGQMKKSKPSNVIIKETLKSVRSILEGIIGSVLASDLVLNLQQNITVILQKLV